MNIGGNSLFGDDVIISTDGSCTIDNTFQTIDDKERNKVLKIKFHNDVNSVAGCLCFGCVNLKSAELSSNIKKIGHDSFNGCISLKKISIPEMLRFIGESAFMDCLTLENLTIPSSIYEIGAYAFSSCKNLNLNIETSLFYGFFDSVKYYIDAGDVFCDTFNVKKISIYGIDFDLNDKYILDKFRNLQKRELNDRINLILNKYNISLKDGDKNKLIDETLRKIRKRPEKDKDFKIIDGRSYLYDELQKYISKKFFIKAKFNKFQRELIYDLDFAIYGNILNEVKKDVKIEEKNNNDINFFANKNNKYFENKTKEEVMELLQNNDEKLITSNVVDIINFGSDLDKYLNYISNFYIEIMQKDNLNRECILKFQENLNESVLDVNFLSQLEEFIDNSYILYNEQINDLSYLKNMILIYLKKLNELLKVLEDNYQILENNLIKESDNLLYQNIIKTKVLNMKKSIVLLNSEYDKVNIQMNNFVQIQCVFQDIKNKIIPLLLMNISSNNKKSKSENIKLLKNISAMFKEILDDEYESENKTKKYIKSK